MIKMQYILLKMKTEIRPENDEEFLETLNNRDNRDIWGKNYCYALEANKVYLIPNIKISKGHKARFDEQRNLYECGLCTYFP